jgi:hypothetical protein
VDSVSSPGVISSSWDSAQGGGAYVNPRSEELGGGGTDWISGVGSLVVPGSFWEGFATPANQTRFKFVLRE